MSNDELKRTESGLTRERILAVWYALCCMHEEGNQGFYSSSIPTRLNFNAKWCAELWRDCTFYSRGWGWRLRIKTPQAWHVTMKERFPITLKDEPIEYEGRELTDKIVALWRAHGKDIE